MDPIGNCKTTRQRRRVQLPCACNGIYAVARIRSAPFGAMHGSKGAAMAPKGAAMAPKGGAMAPTGGAIALKRAPMAPKGAAPMAPMAPMAPLRWLRWLHWTRSDGSQPTE